MAAEYYGDFLVRFLSSVLQFLPVKATASAFNPGPPKTDHSTKLKESGEWMVDSPDLPHMVRVSEWTSINKVQTNQFVELTDKDSFAKEYFTSQGNQSDRIEGLLSTCYNRKQKTGKQNSFETVVDIYGKTLETCDSKFNAIDIHHLQTTTEDAIRTELFNFYGIVIKSEIKQWAQCFNVQWEDDIASGKRSGYFTEIDKNTTCDGQIDVYNIHDTSMACELWKRLAVIIFCFFLSLFIR